jgi:hypothetical protein
MPSGFKGGGDVLEAERFDPEEGTEAEAFVRGNRSEEQDVHAAGLELSVELNRQFKAWPRSIHSAPP